jgi:hypothetical protein
MDWQARALEVVLLIEPKRGFKRGEFEALDDVAWATLVAELRAEAGADHAAVVATLRARVEQLDAVAAAEQRMKAAGVSDADIDALKGK